MELSECKILQYQLAARSETGNQGEENAPQHFWHERVISLRIQTGRNFGEGQAIGNMLREGHCCAKLKRYRTADQVCYSAPVTHWCCAFAPFIELQFVDLLTMSSGIVLLRASVHLEDQLLSQLF